MFNPLKMFRKQSLATVSQVIFQRGNAVWTPRKYDSLADEGYVHNVIAYRCITMIAQACASVGWEVRLGEEVIQKHPVLDLLANPNPQTGGADFITSVVSFLKIAGNVYIEGVEGGGNVREIYALRPDRMRIIAGTKSLASAYEYEVNGQKTRWDVDEDTGDSLIYHWKEFHPLNDWYGMAPIEAGAYAIDQHNEAGRWNQALLQNGARPSGAMICEGNPGEEALKRVKETLLDRMSGASKAGLPIVLGGKFNWVEMGTSPKDMDFNEGVLQSAREICSAFGVPHVLIVPGQATYRNMEEARLMFWEDTIIPILDRFVEGPGSWLISKFERNRFNPSGMRLSYDLSDISALAPRRRYERESLTREYQAGLITEDEWRQEMGWPEKPKTDKKPPTDTPKGNAVRRKDLPVGNVLGVEDSIETPNLFADIQKMLSDIFALLTAEYGDRVIKEVGERLTFERSIDVSNFIKETVADEIRMVNATTKRQVRAILQDATSERWTFAETTAAISDKFKGWSLGRATNIAVTESTRIAGFSAVEAIKQSGIQRKEWLTTLDGHERESHNLLDGQISDISGYFESESGAKAKYPGGFGVAAEDINCRCAVIAAFDQKRDQLTMQQKADIWQKREDFRLNVESAIFKTWQTIFEMQRGAIYDRLASISPTQGSFGDE